MRVVKMQSFLRNAAKKLTTGESTLKHGRRVTHAAVLSHAYLFVILRSFGNPGTTVKPRMTVTVYDYRWQIKGICHHSQSVECRASISDHSCLYWLRLPRHGLMWSIVLYCIAIFLCNTISYLSFSCSHIVPSLSYTPFCILRAQYQ